MRKSRNSATGCGCLALLLATPACLVDYGTPDTGAPTSEDAGVADAGPTDPDLNPELVAARPYKRYVPASYDGTAWPLLVTLHGMGSSGLQQVQVAGLRGLADERHFLLAYPDGTLQNGSRVWNASCCGNLLLDVDDVAYLRALVADMRQRYAVDPRRIYFQGLSLGGFMTYRMACAASDLIAAVAPMAGSMYVEEEAGCTPAHPVAVAHTHGTADDTVLYGGGTFSAGYWSIAYDSTQGVIDHWLATNGCAATPTSSHTADFEPNLTGAETTVQVFAAGCRQGASVELWTMAGGAHIPTINDAYRTAVIDFLYAHPKP